MWVDSILYDIVLSIAGYFLFSQDSSNCLGTEVNFFFSLNIATILCDFSEQKKAKYNFANYVYTCLISYVELFIDHQIIIKAHRSFQILWAASGKITNYLFFAEEQDYT